ncbi:MAG: gamma-glutamyl-gamma-aminobutyrate hydrolase family protein [Burkholderiaceae bacterium]|nr:gamma-glutamyl-gamma-aminobutyrate hydrolase family protein [Burkholderiaceae bacterium]
MTATPSLVWLPMDNRLLGEAHQAAPFLVLGEKYARALTTCAQAQPCTFPLAGADDVDALLSLVDGVMLTGSPANIHPSHFGQTVADTSLPLDPKRDALTLALVTACVAQEVPLLGVCRGFQEINVALGGSLHQQVHNLPGKMDHREDKSRGFDDQYQVAHAIDIVPNSALEQWAGGTSTMVNSLHGQGVDRLADGLEALAFAPDGVVEAFGVKGARTFAYGMQFHPEWHCWDNPFYAAIFKSFGQACAQRGAQRVQGLLSKSVEAVP